MNGAVIVETRKIKGLRKIVLNHLNHLDKDWGLTFFHGIDNEEYVRKELKGIETNFVLIPAFSIDFREYNKMLTEKEFWEQILYEKMLIFQSDSGLLRKGIDEFMKYDYVGAPWTFSVSGGNGGLSLRTKSVMLKIIENHVYTTDRNEDVYFCKYLNKYGKLAPRDICSKFSVEAVYALGSFGYHAPEKWLKPEQVKKILSQYAK